MACFSLPILQNRSRLLWNSFKRSWAPHRAPGEEESVRTLTCIFCALLLMGIVSGGQTRRPDSAQPTPAVNSDTALMAQYCFTCHNERLKTGGLALDVMDFEHVGKASDVWEKV